MIEQKPEPRDEPLPLADSADLQDQRKSVDEEPTRAPKQVPLEADPADVLDQSIVEPYDEEEV